MENFLLTILFEFLKIIFDYYKWNSHLKIILKCNNNYI